MTQLKEQHNREVQKTIDLERTWIDKLNKELEKLNKSRAELEKNLSYTVTDIRAIEIDVASRERKIEVETQRLWK